jgi:hypothetical protein
LIGKTPKRAASRMLSQHPAQVCDGTADEWEIGKRGHPQPVWRAIQNLLLRWIKDETKRWRVPVDNPIRLYGFPSAT